MKAISVLGTSSSAGKTWVSTALCAWLRAQGVRVAPFKAQNMSNNALATADGEISRAQAVQAEACGLFPTAEMNPILLKPSGEKGSKLVIKGVDQGHCPPTEYYRRFDSLWRMVAETLDGWSSRCDVLVMEGAGSPVELNLMERDLVNLRPLRHLDGRFLLVGDIDRGGIYAQLAGTWKLLPEYDRSRALGAIVNKFRGDLSLFPDPQSWLAPHAPGLPVLGTLPFRGDLRPEEEDGLDPFSEDHGEGETIAWVKTPHAAILNDCQPWWDDAGVRTRWVSKPAELSEARVIVLPGTVNTIADMRWLRESGMAEALLQAHARGAFLFGICGGYQILGRTLLDTDGVAGDAGSEAGLGLLPLATEFKAPKIVRQLACRFEGRTWTTYEIHLGKSVAEEAVAPLHTVGEGAVAEPEGMFCGRVAGTYQHAWFEAPEARTWLARQGRLHGHRAYPLPWAEKRQRVYREMGSHLAAHLNLDPLRSYLGI